LTLRTYVWRRRTVVSVTAIALASLTSACVLPMDPGDLPISDPPLVSEFGANVTVVRTSQLLGSYPIHFVALDGVVIAKLKVGEYASFKVSEGQHLLGIRWQIGGAVIVGPYGGGVVGQSRLLEQVRFFHAEAGKSYFFGIRAHPFVWKPEEGITIQPLERAAGEFSLEGKTRVTAGKTPAASPQAAPATP